MIDLTPLDVRKKRGDFTKALRGYEAQQVDSFLELVAERLEELVKDNMMLTERVERLAEQVAAQTGREQAVNDALVTAQQLREEISNTAEREAEVMRSQAQADCDRLRAEADRDTRDLRAEVEREMSKVRIEAEAAARSIVSDAERRVEELHHVMRELERRRGRFLTNFRQLLERELDTVEVQESRTVDEDMPVELDLGGPLVSAAEPAEELPEDLADAEGADEEDFEGDVEATDAGEELFGALDDEEEARVVDDGIRAEPLGVFEPVEDVPPVPDDALPEHAPWGIDDPEADPEAEAEAELEVAEPSDAEAAEAPPERPVSSFFAAPEAQDDDEQQDETPAEIDVELQPPAPDADVHRLATDTRLSADPPNAGLEWLESEESDNDR